jgi:hypothetical protein
MLVEVWNAEHPGAAEAITTSTRQQAGATTVRRRVLRLRLRLDTTQQGLAGREEELMVGVALLLMDGAGIIKCSARRSRRNYGVIAKKGEFEWQLIDLRVVAPISF